MIILYCDHQGEWGPSAAIVFHVQPHQHKQQQQQQQQQQCEYCHQQHNFQHRSGSNSRPLHFNGDWKLARND